MTIDKATATLWIAIEHGDVAAAKAAIEAGADVNARHIIDETALHHAAAFDSSRIVTLLLDSGANATVKDYAGHTPLDIAKRQLLLDLDSSPPWKLPSSKATPVVSPRTARTKARRRSADNHATTVKEDSWINQR